jgi:hypothetical protein
MVATDLNSFCFWDVERQNDTVVLVRVHSCNRQGSPLPDAVFTFRQGDPQYEFWKEQWLDRMQAQESS